jgi:hypothetical protein
MPEFEMGGTRKSKKMWTLPAFCDKCAHVRYQIDLFAMVSPGFVVDFVMQVTCHGRMMSLNNSPMEAIIISPPTQLARTPPPGN